MRIEDELGSALECFQPYPLLFLTISGAHLYGFASRDSDHDLRGAHILPTKEVIGLDVRNETIERSGVRDDLVKMPPGNPNPPIAMEIDLVTHDVRKFFLMLLKRNGYVLEQLYSPLVVHTTPEHAELKEIARGCITRHHAYHYLGFVKTQWELFERERRIKPLLYVYRVLLTGIHLMRTGEIEANLRVLNDQYRLPQVYDLLARKARGSEQAVLDEAAGTEANLDEAAGKDAQLGEADRKNDNLSEGVPIEIDLKDADVEFHRREMERLTAELEQARDTSSLPEGPTARPALNDLLIRLREATRSE
jgi:uncharacterized protein